ncbi:putative protein kinase RLK-Pelle-RLCK-VIIa-2 family [Rosa chinensis]|uniref:Serine-threonine/tyrosine-protein kinase catalytic domain-containing protein n=1 Tax=Rosa chinensis TaxID=74649 RepID=A0A2P6PK73_ROSCH|nr:putative protein kinase RLK-Pelle-RLCK-VIIa-2 family [Rosa chinensis]
MVFAYLAEVDFLGQLHHPNLVKLIGYCIEDDQRLLVYEFMTRGSLENHLFRKCLVAGFRTVVSGIWCRYNLLRGTCIHSRNNTY